MQERKVILTWEAVYDITDITDYIERDFGIRRADRFVRDIRKEIEGLGYTGGIFGNTHIYYRTYTVYMRPFPPSIIFYVVKDEERELHVLRVLREERNWRKILQEQQDYTYQEQDNMF